AWKAEFRHWCRKIVAARFGKIEKRGGHHDADSVATNVLSPSVAAAVPIKPCHGFARAVFKRLAEHVARYMPPTRSIIAVVPQHCRALWLHPYVQVHRCTLLLNPGPTQNYT